MSSPRILLDVPITFDVGGQTTHAPMVHATIRGTPTRLIVDTGSDVHILTIELAEQLGLAAEPGEAGTDSSGASVQSWTLGEVAVHITDQSFDLHDAVANSPRGCKPGYLPRVS